MQSEHGRRALIVGSERNRAVVWLYKCVDVYKRQVCVCVRAYVCIIIYVKELR